MFILAGKIICKPDNYMQSSLFVFCYSPWRLKQSASVLFANCSFLGSTDSIYWMVVGTMTIANNERWVSFLFSEIWVGRYKWIPFLSWHPALTFLFIWWPDPFESTNQEDRWAERRLCRQPSGMTYYIGISFHLSEIKI